MGPAGRHPERRRPGECGHPARYQPRMRPGVAAGAGPSVPEMTTADHQDGATGHEEKRGQDQPVRLPADETQDDGARDGDRCEQGQAAQEKHRAGHEDHRHGNGRGIRLRPLPADGQLRPQGYAQGEEHPEQVPERGQAGPDLLGGIDSVAGESVGMSRASTPLMATSAWRRHESGRSLMSAMSSSANSSPYRDRQSLGYQRSRRAARRAAASDTSLTQSPSPPPAGAVRVRPPGAGRPDEPGAWPLPGRSAGRDGAGHGSPSPR